LGLLKLQKKLTPKTYFYFAHLIDGIGENISLSGMFVRTSIPLILGLTGAVVVNMFGISLLPEYFGLTASFLSVFLLVWPDFLNPELISPQYRRDKKRLYALYISVLVIFGLLGYFGGILGNLIYVNAGLLKNLVDYKELFNQLLFEVIKLILFITFGTFILKWQANSFNSNASKSD